MAGLLSNPAASSSFLPGGGDVRLLAEVGADVAQTRRLLVLDQTTPDGRRFRWLCSCEKPGAPLLAETVVEILDATHATRSGATAFGRGVLLPAYHLAMVAGIGLATARLRSMLFLGVGGGALMLHLAAAHGPRCPRMVGVEADARVLTLARAHFGLAQSAKLRLHVAAGEDFVAQRSRPHHSHRRRNIGMHDAIFLDASSAVGVAPPAALMQAALLRQLRACLRRGGCLVVNVLGTADHVAAVESRVAVAFKGASNVRRRIATDEGNVVLVVVRDGRPPPSQSRSTQPGPRTNRARDHEVDHGDHINMDSHSGSAHACAWRSACTSLGLQTSEFG